jgi:hypothetical protein
MLQLTLADITFLLFWQQMPYHSFLAKAGVAPAHFLLSFSATEAPDRNNEDEIIVTNFVSTIPQTVSQKNNYKRVIVLMAY